MILVKKKRLGDLFFPFYSEYYEVWALHFKKEVSLVETVRRRAIRTIRGLENGKQ